MNGKYQQIFVRIVVIQLMLQLAYVINLIKYVHIFNILFVCVNLYLLLCGIQVTSQSTKDTESLTLLYLDPTKT